MRVIDLATLSLTGGSGIAEAKVTLWSADGTSVSSSSSASGASFLNDGSSSVGTSASASQAKLFTLSSSWSPSQKFAFEATINNLNTSHTAYAALWDMTSNVIVSGSAASTTATTAIVVRSGQLTLTPGHSYGVTVWFDTGSNNVYTSDASLIIFP